MSVPCTLVGTLRDRPGVLLLYRDRLEFLAQVRSGCAAVYRWMYRRLYRYVLPAVPFCTADPSVLHAAVPLDRCTDRVPLTPPARAPRPLCCPCAAPYPALLCAAPAPLLCLAAELGSLLLPGPLPDSCASGPLCSSPPGPLHSRVALSRVAQLLCSPPLVLTGRDAPDAGAAAVRGGDGAPEAGHAGGHAAGDQGAAGGWLVTWIGE